MTQDEEIVELLASFGVHVSVKQPDGSYALPAERLLALLREADSTRRQLKRQRSRAADPSGRWGA